MKYKVDSNDQLLFCLLIKQSIQSGLRQRNMFLQYTNQQPSTHQATFHTPQDWLLEPKAWFSEMPGYRVQFLMPIFRKNTEGKSNTKNRFCVRDLSYFSCCCLNGHMQNRTYVWDTMIGAQIVQCPIMINTPISSTLLYGENIQKSF